MPSGAVEKISKPSGRIPKSQSICEPPKSLQSDSSRISTRYPSWIPSHHRGIELSLTKLSNALLVSGTARSSAGRWDSPRSEECRLRTPPVNGTFPIRGSECDARNWLAKILLSSTGITYYCTAFAIATLPLLYWRQAKRDQEKNTFPNLIM